LLPKDIDYSTGEQQPGEQVIETSSSLVTQIISAIINSFLNLEKINKH
jgi:hypothetical protein